MLCIELSIFYFKIVFLAIFMAESYNLAMVVFWKLLYTSIASVQIREIDISYGNNTCNLQWFHLAIIFAALLNSLCSRMSRLTKICFLNALLSQPKLVTGLGRQFGFLHFYKMLNISQLALIRLKLSIKKLFRKH